MAHAPIRIKRRASGGATGAPSALLNAELAHNEADDTLYIGYGDDGNGNATSIKAVGGSGTFATKAYVASEMANAGAGDMMAATYDPNGVGEDVYDVDHHVDGTTNKVFTASEKSKLSGIEASADVTDAANVGSSIHGATAKTTPVDADTVALIDSAASNVLKKLSWSNIKATLKTYFDTIYAAAGHTHTYTKADVGLGNVDNTSDANKPVSTATQTALNLKANLANPTFTGTPAAPTASAGTNTTQIATTAFVRGEVAALVDGSPGALDTLNELAAALGDDPNFATTVSSSIGEKLAKASNLSDLSNAATARTNLGLGSIATQAANAVDITGGTITGVTIDGGTF